MKRTSVAVKPFVGNSKRVLSDLLIIATVFVALSAFNSSVQAASGSFHVWARDNQALPNFRSVRGNQNTLQFSVTHGSQSDADGVASYVCLIQQYTNEMQVGYIKGWVPINNTDGSQGQVWLDTPTYYVDHLVNGEYLFTYFGNAPVGETHEYWVYLNWVGEFNYMGAGIDRKAKGAFVGYTYDTCVAEGETESHNTRDQMNSYFTYMTAGTLYNNPVPFTNDAYHESYPPYQLYPHPPTTWWMATGQGSS